MFNAKAACRMRIVLLVSGIPLVCIRSQRRVLGFEVRTPRLYPSQVQVYPGKYQSSFTRLIHCIMIYLFIIESSQVID
jgi:hypothetical protein